MIFSSVTFLFLFFPLVFLIYTVIPNIKIKNVILPIFSLLFYAWGEPVYVFLMIFSVFVNWLLGLAIDRYKNQTKLFCTLAVIFNIGILVYFKYFTFLLSLIPFTDFSIQISLPVGISFFTFQALSYVIDVSRKEIHAQKNYLNLLLYISLFPQLIAGPIIKYHDIEKQILDRKSTIDKTTQGLKRFIIGLSKKIIIANQMAIVTDGIFALDTCELNVFSTWIAAICYVLQIYFDFSGYSDMAIGLGKMFGFDFKENFNYPLISTSIKDFWRRWHISLSTWFKEYLYIPLGGNRNGRTYINQFIVFLATGIWHGASLNFVLWGIFHGLFLMAETKGIIPINKIKHNFIKHIYTLFVVTILFVFFRSNTLIYALEFFKNMFIGFDMSPDKILVFSKFLNPFTIFIMLLACICATPIMNIFKKAPSFLGYIICFGLFILNILILSSNIYNPFIYFRF